MLKADEDLSPKQQQEIDNNWYKKLKILPPVVKSSENRKRVSDAVRKVMAGDSVPLKASTKT